MPGIQDPGPSGIAAPNPANLVQLVEPVATPDAVTTMIDAFRKGQISAQDIIDRSTRLAGEKDKAALAQATLQQAAATAGLPLVQPQADAAMSALALQQAKTQAALPLVGPQAELEKSNIERAQAEGIYGEGSIEGFFTLAPQVPGFEGVPKKADGTIDWLTTAKEGGSLIQQSQRRAKALVKATVHESKNFEESGPGGAKVSYTKRFNALGDDITDPAVQSNLMQAATKPLAFSFLKPGAVSASPVSPNQPVPSAPIAAAPSAPPLVVPIQMGEPTVAEGGRRDLPSLTQAEAIKMQQQIERATGQNLGTAVVQPIAQPVAAVAPVEETPAMGTYVPGKGIISSTSQGDWTSTVSPAKVAFQSDPLIMGLKNARAAYDATSDVMARVGPDGNYTGKNNLAKQDDYKLMVNYAKILDPNSVVREGEIALLRDTSSAAQRIMSLMNKDSAVTFGEFAKTLTGQQMFTPDERKNIIGLLQGAYQGRIATANELKGEYENQLRELRVPEHIVKTSFILPHFKAGQAGAPSAASSVGSLGGKDVKIAGGAVIHIDEKGTARLVPSLEQRASQFKRPEQPSPLPRVAVAPLVQPK